MFSHLRKPEFQVKSKKREINDRQPIYRTGGTVFSYFVESILYEVSDTLKSTATSNNAPAQCMPDSYQTFLRKTPNKTSRFSYEQTKNGYHVRIPATYSANVVTVKSGSAFQGRFTLSGNGAGVRTEQLFTDIFFN